MKKVSLSLTQVNYIIEESFNREVASANKFGEGMTVENHEGVTEDLEDLRSGLIQEFKFDVE